jgi:lipid II:glycine glycyltransferase (peptidoglycan interpeptide bridge formation enzyme)
MYDLFRKTNKFKPIVLAAYDDNKLYGVLMGVFIYEKRGLGKLLSSRFVIYGGPLLTGDIDQKKQCLDKLLKALVNITRNHALFIQFRNFFSLQDLIPVYKKNKFLLIDRLNYIVHVSDQETVLKNMSDSRRRQVRKALKSGAEIIEPENISQLRDFYDILYKLYRFKIRKPLPDWSFFESFYQYSINGRLGIIRLIKLDDKIIGGILSPVFEGKCIYEWYVCGLDREYKNQYPSVLATWAGLEYAINNNIQHFDFMGVGRPEKEYGVRDFKARFGGELVNYGRITRINNRFLYSIAELGYNVLAVFKRI